MAAEVRRLIFLDIDGVICCNNEGVLEQQKLDLLRQVVDATGAKIVLSTDWRRIPKLKQLLIATLVGNGMEVVGATPMRIGWQPVRPLEILTWLKGYNEGGGTEERPHVTHFVAVDDRPLLQEHGGDGLRGARRARPSSRPVAIACCPPPRPRADVHRPRRPSV